MNKLSLNPTTTLTKNGLSFFDATANIGMKEIGLRLVVEGKAHIIG